LGRRRRCENADWIAVEAETLIRDLAVNLKTAPAIGMGMADVGWRNTSASPSPYPKSSRTHCA
jgi:hypothetical protein